MNISLTGLIMASGLWVLLLIGCILFLSLGMRFRREYDAEFARNMELKEELARLQAELSSQQVEPDIEGDKAAAEAADDNSVQALEQQITRLEQELAAQKVTSVDGLDDDDPNRVSKLRFDKLNEKYDSLQSLWEGTNQELIRADARIAELLGAKTALEKERDMLQRNIDSFAEGIEASEADTMREIIVNFTEESRELLDVIESQGKEKAELQQKIADMESGGKGTAGAVVGLKRKLEEAEAVIEELREQSG